MVFMKKKLSVGDKVRIIKNNQTCCGNGEFSGWKGVIKGISIDGGYCVEMPKKDESVSMYCGCDKCVKLIIEKCTCKCSVHGCGKPAKYHYCQEHLDTKFDGVI